MGHKITQNGVPVGTWGSKYDSHNLIKRHLINNFKSLIIQTVSSIEDDIKTVSEIGCGEGVISALIKSEFKGFEVKALDHSSEIIEIANKS